MPARDQVLADLGYMLRSHRDYLDLEATQLHYLDQALYIHLVANAENAPSEAYARLTQSILMDMQNVPYAKEPKVRWEFH